MKTTHALPLLLITLSLAACGSSPREEPVSQVAPVTEGEPAPVTPSDEGGDGGSAADREIVADATPPVEQPPAPDDAALAEDERGSADSAPEPAAGDPPPEPAELGRPGWWFAGVRRGDGAVTVCAEAGGRDVRDARRAALDAARRRLGRELDLDPTRERVRFAQVLPLPAADTGRDSARFIGYVMLEAETAG